MLKNTLHISNAEDYKLKMSLFPLSLLFLPSQTFFYFLPSRNLYIEVFKHTNGQCTCGAYEETEPCIALGPFRISAHCPPCPSPQESTPILLFMLHFLASPLRPPMGCTSYMTLTKSILIIPNILIFKIKHTVSAKGIESFFGQGLFP